MLSSIFQDDIDPISYWREIMEKVKKPAAQVARKKLELDQPMGLPGARKKKPLTETVRGFKQTYPTKVIITRVSLCVHFMPTGCHCCALVQHQSTRQNPLACARAGKQVLPSSP